MKKFFLGPDAVTSIAGYLLAGLMVAQTLLSDGETNITKIALAVVVAILGRITNTTPAK